MERKLVMYEKLDKLRAEVRRWKRKLEDDKAKLKLAEQKLQEAENSQILADVGALNLTPEQLAEFLKLVSDRQTLNPGVINTYMDPTEEKTLLPYGKDSGINEYEMCAETKKIEPDGDETEYETMDMEDLKDEETNY